MGKKSLFVTYLLWLFGGFFGLHHLYLGRDFHALIWWMFAGGYFGIGLIRDLWRIPEYVKDANEDNSYMVQLAEKMRKYPKPPSGTVRYFGQVTVSDAFGYLVIGAIPRELLPEMLIPFISSIFAPIAVAVGVYLIGNIGRHEGTFSSALIGAYLSFPVYYIYDAPICLTSLASLSYFNSTSKKWRRASKPKKSLPRRLTFLFLCGLIYLSLWSSWLYFNCTIVTRDQEPVKCRDAAKHFFKSPIWKEFVFVLGEIRKTMQEHGWKEVWRSFIEAFDPTGEKNALKVLDLDGSPTQQEITTRYRKLSREWHPDKHKNLEQKQLAQERFIEIQQAYEILSKIKSDRIAQNVRDRSAEEDTVNQPAYKHDDL
ncbi:dnaJ homolog subfamily C member 22 [Nephila pilipes]|uniref:DnaJ homolog subfamily C member 22 n=1 Tax=Nephila pilipes TaxID=299642 RepID=A0A8X6PS25_NEPPI|nr:dnaJ homolog subfamily C member 22 [Nephila pilipes]